MSEANYVPLSDIAGQELSRLSWHVELNDYIDSSSIGLHVMRLERLTEIGRIAHMRVTTSDIGDDSAFYDAGDINQDGSISFMRVGTSRSELTRSFVPPPSLKW